MSVPDDYPDADRVVAAIENVVDAWEDAAEVAEAEQLTVLANSLRGHKAMAERIRESVVHAKREDTETHFIVDGETDE